MFILSRKLGCFVQGGFELTLCLLFFSFKQNVDRVKLALLSDKLESSSNLNNNDRQSDHLLMVVAYEKWVRILHEVCDQRVYLAATYCLPVC